MTDAMFGSGKNTTCYIRIPFMMDSADLAGLSTMTLKICYDDAFVAYLNGTEVARRNFTGTPVWNSVADTDGHEASSAGWDESIDISTHLGDLQVGDNILAIHGMNRSTTSSDFLISVELEVHPTVIEVLTGISPSAIEYVGGFNFSRSTLLKSRVLLTSGQWSALHEAASTRLVRFRRICVLPS